MKIHNKNYVFVYTDIHILNNEICDCGFLKLCLRLSSILETVYLLQSSGKHLDEDKVIHTGC